MTRETFNLGYAALLAAYSISSKLGDQSQDVYWDILHAIPDDTFTAAVRKCLADCKYFPTIAEIGKAALPTNGLGYNWRQQIERKQRAKQERLPDNMRKLIKGIGDS